ncbi:hypothetical protein Ciccas_001233, partial [Cichlidogyrus casuarinus]
MERILSRMEDYGNKTKSSRNSFHFILLVMQNSTSAMEQKRLMANFLLFSQQSIGKLI